MGKKSFDAKIFNDKKIEFLLSPQARMELKIGETLVGLEPNFNLLFLVGQGDYSSTIMPIMKKFSKQVKRLIIYVAISRPFEKLKSAFLKEKIGLKNARFIDMVTLLVGAQKVNDENVYYLPSTANLNDLVEAIEKYFEEKHRQKLLLFDSISTLLVYNDLLPVEKAVHALIGKLNKFKVDGIFLMAKSKDQASVIQTISQFFDKIVEVDKL